jgi:hypothetical protein
VSAPLRVLDIDLDAFVDPAAHNVVPDRRLESGEHTVWSSARAVAWLTERCHLSGPLPGWAVEHHDEVFDLWRGGLAAGTLAAPFHVTHVDAHGDLCKGTNGYVHLLTDVVHRPLAQRAHPDRGEMGLHEGNYLAYAIGCQWVTDIDYVYGPGGGSDVHSWFMDGFYDGVDAPFSRDTIRLPHLTESDVCIVRSHGRPSPMAFEPAVSIRSTRLEEFKADAGYDVICLCRSPEYTPEAADRLYDAIRAAFVTET